MTKDEAKKRFLELVARYGLRWTKDVPREAYEEMAKVNELLNESDRRDALGLPNK